MITTIPDQAEALLVDAKAQLGDHVTVEAVVLAAKLANSLDPERAKGVPEMTLISLSQLALELQGVAAEELAAGLLALVQSVAKANTRKKVRSFR